MSTTGLRKFRKAITKVKITTSFNVYKRVVDCLRKLPADRTRAEMEAILPWFRRKSKMFSMIAKSTLLDLIKNCGFVTMPTNKAVVLQGDKGDRFYIIAKGRCSVYIKDSTDDMPKEKYVPPAMRERLGVEISVMEDGKSFGELALINDDCIRTASVVADEPTDLVMIDKDLYLRSVACVVNQEFVKKLTFMNQSPLFKDWNHSVRRLISASGTLLTLGYDEILCKQGDRAKYLYFIIEGEMKLVVTPEHHDTYKNFMDYTESLVRSDKPELPEDKGNIFPLAKYISPKNRRAIRLKSAPTSADAPLYSASMPEFRVDLTPSVIRKQTMEHRLHIPKYNVCFLEPGHAIGDIEFFCKFQTYHATAVCTQEASLFGIPKAQYSRIFRKRYPGTVQKMVHNLSLQMPGRTHNGTLLKHVPLYKSIMFKLDEILGLRERRKNTFEDDEGHKPFILDSELNLDRVRCKSGVSLRSASFVNRSARNSAKKSGVSEFGGASRQSRNIKLPDYLIAPKSQYESQIPAPPDTLPRDNIFIKIVHVGSPDVKREDLNISDDEYSYLIQLRRRLARRLDEFYPTSRINNRSNGSTKTVGKLMEKPINFPNLPGSLNESMTNLTQYSTPRNNKVNFELPKF